MTDAQAASRPRTEVDSDHHSPEFPLTGPCMAVKSELAQQISGGSR